MVFCNGIIWSKYSQLLRLALAELLRTDILEQEISSAAVIKRLHPVNSASRCVDHCCPRCSLADYQRVGTDIVGSDPQCVDRLLRVEAKRAVVHFGEVQRKLALEYGRGRPESDVVGTCRSRACEREEVEATVLSSEHGPGGGVVARVDLHSVLLVSTKLDYISWRSALTTSVYESPKVTKFLICPGRGPREAADANPTAAASTMREDEVSCMMSL